MAPEPTVSGPIRIGRYEVLSHLATGGMAQIYLARQSGLGSFERHVVLKTILRERASDQRFVTMFLDEAKLAATLNHQNVAQVFEVDQADGAYFMAMEYVHGENARTMLETTIRRNWTIPLELAVMIVSGAAAGLHHAHERRGKNGQPLNIVHRDVSPANIMVGYDGSIKVLDFGIAKADERATQTVGGTIKGKYGYMSPEQCKGKPIDRRSDIFALGIVLYELATLRRAFKGKDDFETMKRIVAGDLVLPTTIVANFPRELEAIILTALANDASARFQTGQEMIEALDAFAVRAGLTGSNTAMGRFMVQLFGTRKEPWVEAAAAAAMANADLTVVTAAEPMDEHDHQHDHQHDHEHDDGDGDRDDGDDDENDETLILSSKQDVQRALEQIAQVRRPAPSPPQPLPVMTGTEGESNRGVAETTPSLRRTSEQRPGLPFTVPGAERTPPPVMQHPHAPPPVGPTSMSGAHVLATAPQSMAPPYQQFAPPVTGQHFSPTAPPGAPTAPSFPIPLPPTQLGPNHPNHLGWEMSPHVHAPPPGYPTRMPDGDAGNVQLRSNRPWIILAIVAVALVAIVIALAVAL